MDIISPISQTFCAFCAFSRPCLNSYLPFLFMHLLYLDDAGSASNPNEEYLVLGGVSIYEAQAHWFAQQLDDLAGTVERADPQNVELGKPIRPKRQKI